MTRLTRARTPSGPARLAGRSVAVIGTDASPHVTGFPGFTTGLLDLLAEHDVRVSRPLDTPLLMAPGAPGAPELVIAVLPGPGAAGAAAELADRYGVPLLVLHQGETRPPAANSATTGARLAARLQGTALRRADRWAVLSEAARHQLHALGVADARIERLPYWAAPPRVSGTVSAERRTARARFGWDDAFTVVCPVGVDPSGLAAVTEAAAVLAAGGATAATGGIRIRLVGRGPRLAALRAGDPSTGPTGLPMPTQFERPVSGEPVSWTPGEPLRCPAGLPAGLVTVTEVDDEMAYRTAFRAADLLVLSEAAGRPDPATAGRLAAGLAAGRPLIAAVPADGDLAAELRAAEGAMVTVSPDRPRQLADAIDVLRGAPQARAVMSAAARHYTRACLSPVAALDALEALVARTLIAKAEQ